MDDSKAVIKLLVHTDGSVTLDTEGVRMEVMKEGIRIFSKTGTNITVGEILSAPPVNKAALKALN